MKKNKLLKMIGCIALVATPVIVTPIVMLTSCTTTDPINPGVEVTSIQGIKLMQGEKSIIDKSNSGTATYLSAEVADKNATAAIDLTIEIYFYINNDPTPVKLSTIKNKDQIVLNFVCETCSSKNVSGIFQIKDNSNIIISNEKIIEETNYAEGFCYFVKTTDPKGYFEIAQSSSLLLSYYVKDAAKVGVAVINFEKI